MTALLSPIPPERIRLAGVRALPRVIRQDPRGFLMETMRADDAAVEGHRFAMSYTSVTVAGEFRDRDRWHLHRRQTDRFVVPMGEMTLALLDRREGSPTHGLLDVVRMTGAPFDAAAHPVARSLPSALVPIPPGVLHCIGNLTDRPYVLVNYPTELYDPGDEGRVPFSELPVAEIGSPFSWEKVLRPSSREEP